MRSLRGKVIILVALGLLWAVLFRDAPARPAPARATAQASSKPARTPAGRSGGLPRLKLEMLSLPRDPYPTDEQNTSARRRLRPARSRQLGRRPLRRLRLRLRLRIRFRSWSSSSATWAFFGMAKPPRPSLSRDSRSSPWRSAGSGGPFPGNGGRR